ncbi:hypothetical protein EZ449_12275 [Pedobacter frigidisoli]|uniref:Uncharacterized protein n=1 Tax=Pedobacter frigidisoli TaxID=2530455 RepID=A0A4R0P092_9SPHI|nr:DUF6252 family protein [Pedobacter frigidisoli]TCD08609.1 hypothetical protein EZ449_12275 [Pedobacter frigidisoli]
MINFIKICFPIMLVAVLTFSCKKKISDTLELPEATQRGAYTFGCLVDSSVFVPRMTSEIPVLSVERGGSFLKIIARGGPKGSSIGLNIAELKGIGEYPILADGTSSYQISSNNYFATSGKITITRYDLSNKIVSGLFYFQAKHENSDKTVAVQDGRFDLTF